MSTVSLVVSVGEAIDKLSILDIKCRKIKDPVRLSFCKAEYNSLYKELEVHVNSFPYHYRVLTWINESIWNIQDLVRIEDVNQGVRIKQYAIRIQDENDMRFRIKDKINKISLSTLREQKGYPKRRAFFLGHLGLGDLINHIGAIRYYSMLYDEVTVVVKKRNEANARSFFRDDSSITFHVVNEDIDISPTFGCPKSVFESVTAAYSKVILSGFHMAKCHPWDDTSDCFYKDMGLPLEVRHVFNRISEGDTAMKDVLTGIPYIFVHQSSSTGSIKLVKWDVQETLTIDPNTNLYSPGNKWYDIAAACVGKPIVDYLSVITNATEVHVVDSSFSCLAQYAKTTAKVTKCYRRQNGQVIPHFNFQSVV